MALFTTWCSCSRLEFSPDPVGELDSPKLRLTRGYKRQSLDPFHRSNGPPDRRGWSVVTHQPQIAYDGLVERCPLRFGDFDGSVARCRYRGFRHKRCDVICGDRLKEAGRDTVLPAFIGNVSKEVHALCRRN